MNPLRSRWSSLCGAAALTVFLVAMTSSVFISGFSKAFDSNAGVFATRAADVAEAAISEVELGTGDLRRTDRGTAFRLHRDVHFPGARGDQLADLWVPEAKGGVPCPAVLLVHGGGWVGGEKDGARMVEFAAFLVDEGYAAVSVNYTLTKFLGGTPRGAKIRGAWPDNLYDCKSALRWMKRIAPAIGTDPNRVAVWGASAGGHLALLCGLSSACMQLNPSGGALKEGGAVRCVVDFYGITDVRRFGTYALMEDSDRADTDVVALASPVGHCSKDSPPVLVIHGGADEEVEVSLSEDFAAVMWAHGAHCELKVLPDAGHGFGLRPAQGDLSPLVAGFLRKYL